MNKKDLIKRITTVMRENNMRKPISSPKQVFHISDDNGNSKDFVVRATDKSAIYTADDVERVLDACIYVIQESLMTGEPVVVRGFGELGLKYRKPRAVKSPDNGEWIKIRGHYIPKFDFGKDLRRAAEVYETSLQDKYAGDLMLPQEDI